MRLLDMDVSIGMQDNVSSKLEALSTSAIAKGNLIANALTAAFSAVGQAAGALIDFGQKSLDAYANYEQLVGGVETLFQDSSDQVLQYADRAFANAGISANKYLELATSFAASLVSSVSQGTSASVQQGTEELEAELDNQVTAVQDSQSAELDAVSNGFEAQNTALQRAMDAQYKTLQRSLDAQYKAKEKSIRDGAKALQKALDDEYDARKKAFDKAYKALQRTLDDEYDARKKSLDKAKEAYKDSLDDEYDEAKKAADKKLDALKKANDKEVDDFRKASEKRIKQTKAEYDARIKAIDDEAKARARAIDDQIDALDAEQEAEERAEKERENGKKAEELRDRAQNGKTAKERREAQEELNELLADIEADKRKEERQARKDALRDEKEDVKERADERKEELKSERDQAVDAAKEASDAKLAAMKEANDAEEAQLKESLDRQLKSVKESNEEKLREFSDSQDEELKKLKQSQQDQLEAYKDAQDEELKKLKETNTSKIDAYNEQGQKELNSLKESQQDQLEAYKQSQQDRMTAQRNAQQSQLKSMQAAHKAQLAEVKKSVKEQKKALGEVGANEFASATSGDYAKAAELANTAIIDMADNANKMGTNMEDVENAYRGFSKQNFTMLDNLKLGFGGTKSEAERLVERAEAIEKANGHMVDYSVDSFADMVEAIHVVQQEMYISGMSADEAAQAVQNGSLTWDEAYKLMGTTAKEGSTTIQGSIMAVSAAWEDWLVALADPEQQTNLEERTNNLVDTFVTAAGNIVPKVGAILGNIAKVVAEQGPQVFSELSEAFLNALPEDVREDFKGFFDQLSELWTLVTESVIPAVIDGAKQAKELHDKLKPLRDIGEAISKLYEDNLKVQVEAVGNAFSAAAGAVGGALNAFGDFVQGLGITENDIDNAVGSIEGIFLAMENPVETMINNIVGFFGSLPSDIPKALGDNLDTLLNGAGNDVVQGFIDGITGAPSSIANALWDRIGGGIDTVKSWLGIASPSKLFKELGGYTMQGFAIGIEDEAKGPEDAMRKAAEKVYGAADGEVSFSSAAAHGDAAARSRQDGGVSVNVDVGQLVVREEADIDRIADRLYKKIKREQEAGGWSTSFTMA